MKGFSSRLSDPDASQERQSRNTHWEREGFTVRVLYETPITSTNTYGIYNFVTTCNTTDLEKVQVHS
jgi:hypothetical protein